MTDIQQTLAAWREQAEGLRFIETAENQGMYDGAEEEADDAVANTLLDCATQIEEALKSSGAQPRTFYTIHFTGEGFRTLAVYRLFFKRALERVREQQAAYDAEVKAWYEEHPGYQFPHCIHGSSLTTDYDNICGDCESGDSPIELAIQHARERFLRFLDRWEWACKAPGDLDYQIRNDLLGWACECFPYNARNGG